MDKEKIQKAALISLVYATIFSIIEVSVLIYFDDEIARFYTDQEFLIEPLKKSFLSVAVLLLFQIPALSL